MAVALVNAATQSVGQWNNVSFLAFIPATCTQEGAISVIDDVVLACVNGSSKSLCYADENDILSSLAEAACSRDGLQLDSKSYLNEGHIHNP